MPAVRPKASVVWTAVWSFSLSFAVVACDDDARADGDAVEKADEQEDQTAGGADGGIGVLIQKAADDKGVSCVVELLENVSEQDGQGKKQHAAPDRAGGQRMLHLRLLFFSEILLRHGRSVPQSCLRTGNRGKERMNGNRQGLPSRSITPRSGKKMQNNNSILHFCKRLSERVRKDLWDKLQTCCLKLAAGCRDSAIIIAWFFRSRKSCCTPRKKCCGGPPQHQTVRASVSAPHP